MTALVPVMILIGTGVFLMQKSFVPDDCREGLLPQERSARIKKEKSNDERKRNPLQNLSGRK